MTFWLDAEVVNGVIAGGTKISTIPSSEWYSLNAAGDRYPGTLADCARVAPAIPFQHRLGTVVVSVPCLWPGNAPFDQPFNIILNVAVGGSWPCSVSGCCDNIALPADMVVSTVEVWELTQ